MNPDPATRRRDLYALLGDLPERHRPIAATKTGETRTAKYILETLVLDLNGLEAVPAYFARPLDAGGTPRPTVLYNHSHGGRYDIGKEELVAGREYLHTPPYAETLTQLGFNVLCIDAWVFGERSGRTESSVFKEMLWRGRVLWGMMIYDGLRALDYLHTRPDVDVARIATLGMSMGSTASWWLAALDERITVCVDICCQTDFEAIIESRGLDEHGIYYYVPGLLKHFSAADINALIAPRPHLALAGTIDPLTPLEGLDRIDRRVQEVYAAIGAPDAWRLFRSPTAHIETPEMRREILAFLRTHLSSA